MGFAFERQDPGSASRLPSGLYPALTSILNDERGAMAQERAQRPPAEQLVAAARRVLHGPLSPYGRDPAGEAGLAAVTRPELRRAYDDAYDPRRAVLVISGGVAGGPGATQLVRRYFGPLATLSPAPRSDAGAWPTHRRGPAPSTCTVWRGRRGCCWSGRRPRRTPTGRPRWKWQPSCWAAGRARRWPRR